MGYSIYKLTSPNGKIYIGATKQNPLQRWNSGKGYKQNKELYGDVLRYGWESFKREILYSGISKEDAAQKEIELIALFDSTNSGYNKSTGGTNPAQGVKQSVDAVRKRAIANTGKKRTREQRERLSESKKGRPNMRRGKLGKESGNAGILTQINERTHETVAQYYGYGEMTRATGYARTPVLEAANGKRKRAYGYAWKYEKVH